MTDSMKCPFCGYKLNESYDSDENIVGYFCANPHCRIKADVLEPYVWQALIDAKKAQDALKNSREKLAAFMHDTWADWFVYQFNNSTVENIQRWQIQSKLPYSSLLEKDKDKDRKFADKIISIITKQEE